MHPIEANPKRKFPVESKIYPTRIGETKLPMLLNMLKTPKDMPATERPCFAA